MGYVKTEADKAELDRRQKLARVREVKAMRWRVKMKDKPCYCPTPCGDEPIWDLCFNMGKEVKRLDCAKCVAEKGLSDIGGG